MTWKKVSLLTWLIVIAIPTVAIAHDHTNRIMREHVRRSEHIRRPIRGNSHSPHEFQDLRGRVPSAQPERDHHRHSESRDNRHSQNRTIHPDFGFAAPGRHGTDRGAFRHRDRRAYRADDHFGDEERHDQRRYHERFMREEHRFNAEEHERDRDEPLFDLNRGDWTGEPEWEVNIPLFRRFGLALWQSGQWRHGWHHGRWGWWWLVHNVWYYYPEPSYPYPSPYVPGMIAERQSQPGEPPSQAPVGYWYYCKNPKGYYPYIPKCPGGWTRVPAKPPGAH